MIVVIYSHLPARYFKGWTKRSSTGSIVTTPDLDQAKDVTEAMADRIVNGINDYGVVAVALANPPHVHTARCSPDWCRA